MPVKTTRTARRKAMRIAATIVHRAMAPARIGRRNRGLGLVLALVLRAALPVSFSSEARAEAPVSIVSCEHEIAIAARRYDIPLAVFYAVGLNETGGSGRLQPFAMNIDGRASFNASLADALARFRTAKSAGARMIDIGCMQINHHYHGASFESVEAMFDPARNVDYAARFLRDLRQRERSWTMAVARYNAGPNNDPAQKQYVCGVLTRMVASGFGAWTPTARAFCAQPSVKASL